MKPLRVLHVIASMSPGHGGPTNAIYGIIPHLTRQGIECLVASTNDDLADTLPVTPGVEVEHCGARGIYFPNLFRNPRQLRDFAISPSFSRWLGQNIMRFDVVHVHALFSFITTRTMSLAHKRGVPYVCRPLGVLGTWPLRSGTLHKRLYLGLVERRLLNHATAIEYNSESEREEAAALCLSAPATVIPLGFTPVPEITNAREVFCKLHGLPANRLNVLFLSRIHPKKGLARLIEACAALPGDSFNLIIAGSAGDPAFETEMRSLVQRSGLESNVTWTGFLDGGNKALALRAADVFALPSLSESFGIAVAEAMSAGCAIITTPEVPLSDLVRRERAGWVTHDIARALKDALENPRERTSAEAARSLTYEAVAPALADLYRSCAKTPAGEVAN